MNVVSIKGDKIRRRVSVDNAAHIVSLDRETGRKTHFNSQGRGDARTIARGVGIIEGYGKI